MPTAILGSEKRLQKKIYLLKKTLRFAAWKKDTGKKVEGPWLSDETLGKNGRAEGAENPRADQRKK